MIAQRGEESASDHQIVQRLGGHSGPGYRKGKDIPVRVLTAAPTASLVSGNSPWDCPSRA